MNEQNKDTLRNALQQLPQHDAPADAWEEITQSLRPALAKQLPSYQPPAEVWNGLSVQLGETAGTKDGIGNEVAPRTKIRRLWPRVAGIAAALLLAVSLGTGFWDTLNQGPTVSYARSQEAAPAPSFIDLKGGESSFSKVRAEIEYRNEPSLNTLALELDELTYAKEEIKAILVAYGEDPNVIRQLAEIERDRSDVYRRIIVEL